MTFDRPFTPLFCLTATVFAVDAPKLPSVPAEPVSAANPNGIEIIQPRVARRGLPWEHVINRHQL